MGLKIGRQCKLFYSTTPLSGTPTWVEFKLAEEITPTTEHEEAKLRNRESEFEKVGLGLTIIGHEVRFTYRSGNAGYEAFRDAFTGKTDIAVFIADGAAATVGTEGWQYDAKVTKFPRAEGLAEFATVSMTLKPSADSSEDPELVEVSA